MHQAGRKDPFGPGMIGRELLTSVRLGADSVLTRERERENKICAELVFEINTQKVKLNLENRRQKPFPFGQGTKIDICLYSGRMAATVGSNECS